MITRSDEEQKIHDLVLEDSAASYLNVTRAENILTNQRQVHQISGLYPDLIVKLPTGEIIIEEIATDSEVNVSQLEMWRQFASLGHDFRLIVPLGKLETVKAMAADLAVNIQAYEVVDGQVHWFGKNT